MRGEYVKRYVRIKKPILHGMWRSLVAHFVRDEGAAGSNPVIPIYDKFALLRYARCANSEKDCMIEDRDYQL